MERLVMTSRQKTTPTSVQDRPDFVSSDWVELASHMNHCASSRSRMFGLHSAFQFMHSLVSPRIITFVALVAICVSLLAVA